MKTQQELEARLAEIEADERLHYRPALVQVNAPLALIQTALATEANALRWALDLPRLHYGKQENFRCAACDYQAEADVVGAVNVLDRFGK